MKKKLEKVKEKLFAWHLESPLARLPEKWLLGDCNGIFLSELSNILKGNEVILDMGAGTGRFSLEIAKKFKIRKLICLDFSEKMLQQLTQKVQKMGLQDNIEIVKEKASSSGLKAASVDVVISNNLLHEVSNPERILKEMLRVVKPNGWIILTDFKKTYLTQWICHSHGKKVHGPFQVHELKALLVKEGLRRTKVYPIRNWVIGIGKK